MTHIDDALKQELLDKIDNSSRHVAHLLSGSVPHGVSTYLYMIQGNLSEMARLLTSTVDPYMAAVEDHLHREQTQRMMRCDELFDGPLTHGTRCTLPRGHSGIHASGHLSAAT